MKVLSATLWAWIIDRLDYLDRLADYADIPSRAALAEIEIVQMTAGWRALLAAHNPTRRKCPNRRRPLRPRAHYRLPASSISRPSFVPFRREHEYQRRDGAGACAARGCA